MGHRDIETTLRYAHLAPDHLKDGVNRGSLFGSEAKTDSGTLIDTLVQKKIFNLSNWQKINSNKILI